MKKLLCGMVAVLAVVAAGAVLAADKPKTTIADVMKFHKGKDSLLRKVAGNEGTKADAEKLLSLYQELGKNTPPKGTKDEWKKRTDALVVEAKKLATNPKNEDAGKALLNAAKCQACHDVHQDE